MDQVEAMAVREPLLAKTLMLDTMHKDDQKRDDFALDQFGYIPKVKFPPHFEIARLAYSISRFGLPMKSGTIDEGTS